MTFGPELVIIPFGLLLVGSSSCGSGPLVDAIQVPDDSMYRSGTKLVWVLVIVLTQVVGAIIYFAIGRPPRRTAHTGPPPPPPPPPPTPSSGVSPSPGTQSGWRGPTLGASARKVRIHELWT